MPFEWTMRQNSQDPPDGREKIAEEREKKAEEKELAARGAGASAYVLVAFVLLVPAVSLSYFLYTNYPPELGTAFYLAVFFLAELLAGLLLVARWFQRLTSNSDIEELRKMAFSYRLGGSLALRPFLNSHGESLLPNSPLKSYREGIIEPNFYKSAANPPFLLAMILVVSLGLFAFFAPQFNILADPSIFLLGPELGYWKWDGNGSGPPNQNAFMAYAARALVCVSFAFAGALVWAVTYLTRRMALRDVTGHTYQELSMRLVVSAVVSLVAYHLLSTSVLSNEAPSGAVLMLLSFGAGMLPETMIRWIYNKAARLFGAAEQNDYIDLEHIHGISAFTRSRLAEVGIYDAQGLVATNPLRLSLHTPFSLPQLLDWYGQAFLLLHLRPAGLRALREFGIRTIWEAEKVWQTLPLQNVELNGCGKLCEALERVFKAVSVNPCYVRVTELHDRMRERPQQGPSSSGGSISQSTATHDAARNITKVNQRSSTNAKPSEVQK
jgi:hypothetical protein